VTTLDATYAAGAEERSCAEWVRAAAAGSQPAWNCLVERYNAMVWSIARSFRLDVHDASDVVQTTWLRLLEHLDRIKEPSRIGSWLATTARNECLVHLRRRGRAGLPLDHVGEVVDVRAAPEDALLGAERDAVLFAALDRLPDRCRQLLRILASDPAPSYQEVSAVLGMPVGSIGPTRARCLERVRQNIAERPRGIPGGAR
jgi:RNA polymerase sigma factor (sigma-70 family)